MARTPAIADRVTRDSVRTNSPNGPGDEEPPIPTEFARRRGAFLGVDSEVKPLRAGLCCA